MWSMIEKWKEHIIAIAVYFILSVIYFSPAVFDGKIINQGDNIKATGMGGSHAEKYANTALPGEFSLWSDAMFSGMPYGPGYGNPALELPTFKTIEYPIIKVGPFHASIILMSLICFYILMCVMGVNLWLAIAGSIAFALASYNIIIIEAGHITKAYAIAYMPLTIAGIKLLFNRKYLFGGLLFLLGIAFSVGASHIQITYYLMLLCLFIYAGYAVKMFKEKAYGEWLKTSLIMLGCVILAVMPNARGMYSNWDLGQHSIRGQSELTPKADENGVVEKASTGLDKDYAFQWSQGRMELLTSMIPNAYGGASGGTLDSSSELYKELKRHGVQTGKEVQTYTYWGDKPFTSGPVYFGAVVCFLFVLGMFVIRNPMKWWLFAGSLFLTLLALGRNFDAFNDIMFHYLPLYNKFRAVEMALVIPGLVFPIVAVWGLHLILKSKVEDALLKKGFLWSLGITGGICLLVWLIPSLLLDFHTPYDAQFQNQVPDWYYNALLTDRTALASSDALRSLVYILLGAGLLFWFWKSKKKEAMSVWVSAGIVLLIVTDLWTIDRRYLNDSNYVKETAAESYKESAADREIFKDTDQSFRVLGLNNPWQDTNVSYFHHSVGGYHAVKLRRYQELIDFRLGKEHLAIVNRLQNIQSVQDILPVLAASPSLNMLNMRYIIYNPEQPPLKNPFACGNCWFAESMEVVENADAEIAALDRLNPLQTAVVDKRFAKDMEGFTPQKDSTATIVLENYRPNRLIYKSNAGTEQLAVFSEIYYPGWKAKIDGKEAPHFRADWTLRAMRIPAGKHTVVFEFLPDTYITAANVSAYSSFLILLLLIGVLGWTAWQAWSKSREPAN
ncbi:putative membrane protein [Bacteroidales bacterium Barb6]|nr:putative membrane protein [Bacteroidales bacterium Barb6]